MKIGDKIHVWWKTGTVENGENIARIIEIKKYAGNFKEFFDCVLVLNSCTARGFCEMAYNTKDFTRYRQ